jgi:hypothetical protein
MQDAPPALMRQWAMRWSNADCAAAADGSCSASLEKVNGSGEIKDNTRNEGEQAYPNRSREFGEKSKSERKIKAMGSALARHGR